MITPHFRHICCPGREVSASVGLVQTTFLGQRVNMGTGSMSPVGLPEVPRRPLSTEPEVIPKHHQAWPQNNNKKERQR